MNSKRRGAVQILKKNFKQIEKSTKCLFGDNFISHKRFFPISLPRRSQRRSAERADGHRAADYHLVAGRERGLQGDTVHPGVGHVRVHLCPGGAQYRSLRCDYPSDELFRML